MKYEREIVSDPAYIKDLRNHRCVFTLQYAPMCESVVPMHVGNPGKGLKTDNEAMPILNRFHVHGHQHGEVSMFRHQAPEHVIRDACAAYERYAGKTFDATGDALVRLWRTTMGDFLIREAMRAFAREYYAEWRKKQESGR